MQFNKAHIWRTEMVLWKEMNEGGKGGKERCAASECKKAKDELVRTCRIFKKTLETTRRE